MTRFRVWPALALAAGLFLVSVGTSAQPPNLIPVGGQPKVVQVPGQPKIVTVPSVAELPVVPKSAAAFLSLKLSDVIDHPDLKPVLEQLKKNPEVFEGLTELFGVLPHEIDRITLFWPSIGNHGPGEPVVVVTTREAYNEARVLKLLKADPVFDDGPRGGDSFAPARGEKSTRPPAEAVPFNEAPANPKPGIPDGPPGAGSPPKGPPGAGSPPPGAGSPPKGPPVEPPPFEKKDNLDDDANTVPIVAAAPADPLFYELHNRPFEVLLLVDDRTMVFLPGGHRSEFTVMALLTQLMQKKTTGPLAEAIVAAGGHTVAAGVYLPPLFREFDRRMPPELAPYAALTAAKVATITGDLGKTAKVSLKLTFDDAAAAKRAAPVLEEGLRSIAEKAIEHVAEIKDSRRPGEKALAPLLEAAAAGFKKATVKAEGTAVTATTEIDAGPASAKAVGDLLASLASRKKYVERTNNLKQIGLALVNYFDVNGKLPANIYGPKGELLLSWRVQLLPYLEQQNLYLQFKMDEAWDGPNNKKLIEQMPKVFDVPGRDAPKGHTYFQAFLTPNPDKPKGGKAFTGRTWLIEGDKQGQSLLVPDGTSNTLAAVEARTSVIWSKPDDLPFGEKLPPLGEEKGDVFMALFLDGSVRAIPTNIKPDILRLLIDGYDGMVIPDFENERPRGFPLRPGGGGGAGGGKAVAKDEAVARRFGEIRLLEERIAQLSDELAKETTVAELQAVLLEQNEKLFAAGAIKKEELDQAKAASDEARARVEKRRKELEVLDEQKRALLRGDDSSAKTPAKPKDGLEPLPTPKGAPKPM